MVEEDAANTAGFPCTCLPHFPSGWVSMLYPLNNCVKVIDLVTVSSLEIWPFHVLDHEVNLLLCPHQHNLLLVTKQSLSMFDLFLHA